MGLIHKNKTLDLTHIDILTRKLEAEFLKINDLSNYSIDDPQKDFSKTYEWVCRYSPNKKALESINEALYSILGLKGDADYAREIRRFIKFSSNPIFDNVPLVISFGQYIKKIGDTIKRRGIDSFQCIPLDMDNIYWELNLEGVNNLNHADTTDKKRDQILNSLNDLSRNISEVFWSLEDYYKIIDDTIDITPENKPKSQYFQDFLKDARSFYKQPSFFDILRPKTNPETSHYRNIEHKLWLEQNK